MRKFTCSAPLSAAAGEPVMMARQIFAKGLAARLASLFASSLGEP